MRDFYRDKRVLVTGGLGFIGSNLAIALVESGAKVHILDSLMPGHGGNRFNIEPIQDEVEVQIADVRDTDAIRPAVTDAEIIFNLAGQVCHIDSMEDPMTDLEINCKAQLSLLEACREENPDVSIVFASTRQMYGKPKYLPVDEEHLLEPVDVNGINKMAGEWYHLLYSRVYDMRCSALRLTNTYGPRQKINNRRHGFVGTFLLQALQGQDIQLFGDGSQLRDFNYIDDVVDAMLITGQTDALNGVAYNLGHHEHHSLLEFVETLHEFCDFSFETIPFPEERKRIDIGDYYSSYEKFRAATGWEPKVDLRTGLGRTVEYFREHLPVYA